MILMLKINGIANAIINHKPSKNRKSIAIKIKNGEIFLYSPNNISIHQLQKILDSKQRWIINNYLKDKEQYLLKQSTFKNNNQYLILGSLHKTIIKHSNKNIIQCFNNNIYIYLENPQNLDQGKTLLHNWLQQQTLQIVTNKCSIFAEKMQLKPRAINIKNYKSRWGCCKSNGEIIFHDLLYMMPEKVIDAIVIHELAHLLFPNHSKAFWQYVYKFCPNYKEAHNWLNQNKYQIYI